MDEYDRLKGTLEQMATQVNAMQSDMNRQGKESTSQQRQLEEIRKERQELFEKCLASEQALSDS